MQVNVQKTDDMFHTVPSAFTLSLGNKTLYDYQHAVKSHTLYKTQRKTNQNSFNRKYLEKCTRLSTQTTQRCLGATTAKSATPVLRHSTWWHLQQWTISKCRCSLFFSMSSSCIKFQAIRLLPDASGELHCPIYLQGYKETGPVFWVLPLCEPWISNAPSDSLQHYTETSILLAAFGTAEMNSLMAILIPA